MDPLRTPPKSPPKSPYPPSTSRVVATGGFSNSNRRHFKKISRTPTAEEAAAAEMEAATAAAAVPSPDELASLFRDARSQLISVGAGTKEDDICKRLEAAARYTAAVIDSTGLGRDGGGGDLADRGRSVRSWGGSVPATNLDGGKRTPWSNYGNAAAPLQPHSEFVRSLHHLDDDLTNFFLYNYADGQTDARALHQTLKATERKLDATGSAMSIPDEDGRSSVAAFSMDKGADLQQQGQADRRHSRHASVATLHLSKGADRSTTSGFILKLLGSWDFNIFALDDDIVKNSVNCYVIVGDGITQHHNGLITKLDLDHPKFICMLQHLGEAYLDNPYHNCLHGADVCQALNWTLSKGGVAQAFAGVPVLVDGDKPGTKQAESSSEIPATTYLAALLAALSHDVGHPGMNNNYLVATAHELALRYNDHSPLEHMHAATLFSIISRDACNFLTCDQKTRKAMRGIIIDMILSTDMVKHSGLMSDLNARLNVRGHELSAEPGDIQLVLNICLHLSDISNPARPTLVAVKWAKRIQEEFWRQGDLMREHAMDVPPMHDRAHAEANITFESQSQIGFTQFLVKPLFEIVNSFARVDLSIPLKHIANNLEVQSKLKADGLAMTQQNIEAVQTAAAAEAAEEGEVEV